MKNLIHQLKNRVRSGVMCVVCCNVFEGVKDNEHQLACKQGW